MDQDYLVHYGVLGMKWGVRRNSKSASSSKRQKTISRKEYKNIVRKNKQILVNNKYRQLFAENDKAAKLIQKESRMAVKNINDARVKRGKKIKQKIMFNLPGTLV